jgi:hypothetical protein
MYHLAQEMGTIAAEGTVPREEIQFNLSWARGATALDQLLREIKSTGDKASMNHVSRDVWTRVAKAQPHFDISRGKMSLGAKQFVDYTPQFLQIATDSSREFIFHSMVTFFSAMIIVLACEPLPARSPLWRSSMLPRPFSG